MKTIILSLICLASAVLSAQCPTITIPSTLQIGCSAGQTVAATANYTSNIVSRWIGPGNVQIASSGGANSIAYLNYVTTYTVEFTDTLSHCVVIDSVKVVSNFGKPVFNLISPENFTLGCGSFSLVTIQMVNASATSSNQIPNGGPVTFTFGMGSFTPAPGLLSTTPFYTLNACGMYQVLVRDNNSSCASSYNFIVTCTNVAPPANLSVSPNSTICIGSSAKLTAQGMNTYTWSTGQNTPSIAVMPSVTTVYHVTSNNLSSCVQSRTVSVTVDSTCAMVWPGDCNSDGIVNSNDVFEIGLSYNNSGGSRSNASNNYVGQKAPLWNTNGSNAQDESHIDCNGDGTINSADTAAIYNNYGLPHAFKPSPAGVSLLSIQTPQNVENGQWHVADISVVGTASFFGVAFDVEFDPTLVESVYLSYPSSFLTAPGQNTILRKPDYTTAKLYAASVRNGGSSVSGSGKIAELHYKIKSAATTGAILQLGLTKIKSCNSQGNISNYDPASVQTAIQVYSSIPEKSKNILDIFPNPANTEISIKGVEGSAMYQISDLSGRLILNGTLPVNHRIDVSTLSAGIYQLKLSDVNGEHTVKIQVAR